MPYRNDSEARLAAIIASSDDAIVSKDFNGIIQTWNRGAERIFGYSPAEAIGQSIMLIVPPDRIAEEHEVLARIRSGRSVEHFETMRRRKDGTLVDISLTVSPILSQEGTVIGASKIARDISEQRRLRARVEEASREKDAFLAVLSHELRTPLNAVVGYARMLRSDHDRMTPELRERALDALERNADALTRLVNDVLDTSRIVTGKLRLALEACAIDQLVNLALETSMPGADAKGILIQTRLEPGLTVLGDRDRIQQIVWNLMSNAIKFTPPAGTITIRAQKSGSSVELSIQDSGIGIAKDHLPFVFQRFWQADTGVSREFGGLGIGLALTRHLVELHGGTINVDSGGLGRGSIFTMALPAPSMRLAREHVLRPVAK
jgi:PAS domain S-box-containing protein